MGLFSRLAGRHAGGAPAAARLAGASVGAGGFAVVDLETTGFGPSRERVLELGIVCTGPRGEVVDEWVSRFDPQGRMGAEHIHGISAADLAGAPLFADCVREIIERLRGRVLVAHNAAFDLAFLRAEFDRAGWELPELPVLCTLEASWTYLPGLASRRLADCCAAAGIHAGTSHVALGDAHAAAALLRCFLDPRIPPAPLDEHAQLVHLGASVSWPDGPARKAKSVTEAYVASAQAAAGRRARIRLAAPLRAALPGLPLEEALAEGAPAGSTAYLQLVLDVIADGVVSAGEQDALEELAVAYGLSGRDRQAAHTGLLAALARRAVADSTVSREEREQLRLIARLLGLAESFVPQALAAARDDRAAALSEELAPPPEGWTLGEPLRVGDRIAFTGCDDHDRAGLEQRAVERGITVSNAISRTSALLVSDGTVFGNKARDAEQLGVRVVTPEVFAQLLEHVQPAQPRPARRPAPPSAAPSAKAGTDPSPAAGVDPAAVRAWALAEGIHVGSGGRLPQDLLDAYLIARDGDPSAAGT